MKKLLIVFIVIVAIIAGGGLFLASQLDESRLRAMITTTANEHLNAELSIDGPLSFSIFPSVGARLEGIHLTEAGGDSVEIASAGNMRVGLRLRPLLSGNLDIEEISLEDFSIELTREADGSANWEQIVITSEQLEQLPDAQPAPADTTPAQSADAQPTLAIERLNINNGTVIFNDRQAQSRYELSGMKLEANNVNTTGVPFDLAFRSQLAVNKRPPSDLSFAGTGLSVAPDAFDAGKWTIKGPGVEASGTARVAGDKSHAEFSMSSDLLALMAALDMPAPTALNPKALESVELSLALDAIGDALTLAPGSITFADTRINFEGNADLSNIPTFKLAISSALIDVDRLLAPAADTSDEPGPTGSDPAPAKGQATAAADRSSPAPAAASPFKATLSAKVDRLLASGYEVSDATVELIATPGRVNVQSLSAAMYGGKLDASTVIDQRPGSAGLTANATLSGVDVAQLLTASGQELKAQGKVDASLDLKATGAGADAWMKTLAGPVSMKLAQLRLDEINGEKLLCTALATLNQESLTQPFPTGTDLKDVYAQLEFTNGTATIRKMEAEIPNLRLRGDGTISLANSRLDTVITANITGDLEQLDPACRVTRNMQSIDWPLTCKGGFHEEPGEWCRVTSDDLAEIATKLTADKVQKKVEKKLQKLFGL